jgi:hypothetical protein
MKSVFTFWQVIERRIQAVRVVRFVAVIAEEQLVLNARTVALLAQLAVAALPFVRKNFS